MNAVHMTSSTQAMALNNTFVT